MEFLQFLLQNKQRLIANFNTIVYLHARMYNKTFISNA